MLAPATPGTWVLSEYRIRPGPRLRQGAASGVSGLSVTAGLDGRSSMAWASSEGCITCIVLTERGTLLEANEYRFAGEGGHQRRIQKATRNPLNMRTSGGARQRPAIVALTVVSKTAPADISRANRRRAP